MLPITISAGHHIIKISTINATKAIIDNIHTETWLTIISPLVADIYQLAVLIVRVLLQNDTIAVVEQT